MISHICESLECRRRIELSGLTLVGAGAASKAAERTVAPCSYTDRAECQIDTPGETGVSVMTASRTAAKRVSEDRSACDEAVTSAPLLEISNAMVRLHKEAFGRGPTKARTQFPSPDTVLIVLEDGFTTRERTLLALSKTEEVRESRLTIQEALEAQVRSTVQEVLGRRTLAFVTGVDVRHGIAIILCTLESVPSVQAGKDRDSSL